MIKVLGTKLILQEYIFVPGWMGFLGIRFKSRTQRDKIYASVEDLDGARYWREVGMETLTASIRIGEW